MTKVNPNKARHFYMGHIQIQRRILFLSFMIQVNRNNGNETKSGIFSWDILKSDIIYFFIKKY